MLGTAPLSALLGWLISFHWMSMPPEASAAAGTVLSAALLVFAHSIKHGGRSFGGAVWEYGVLGCCRRVWRGKP